MLEQFYKEQKQQSDKLKSLPLSRFRLKPPVLKGAQAAIVRKLVPWLVQLLQPGSWHWGTWKGHGSHDGSGRVLQMPLPESCVPACLFEAASCHFLGSMWHTCCNLHGWKPEKYALQPKVHLFQELCSQGIQPSQGWVYRKEDFGGSLAAMAHIEGAVDIALSTSRTCLSRFCTNAHPPSLMAYQADPWSSSVWAAWCCCLGVWRSCIWAEISVFSNGMGTRCFIFVGNMHFMVITTTLSWCQWVHQRQLHGWVKNMLHIWWKHVLIEWRPPPTFLISVGASETATSGWGNRLACLCHLHCQHFCTY